MNPPTPTPPAVLNATTVVDAYDLYFDAADKTNGSLYVCTPRGGAAPQDVIDTLRAAALWSPASAKSVPDEQRQAYKDGLEFVAAVAYAAGAGHVLLARFDHPKFPSDAARWQAWLAQLDRSHERLD